MKIRRKFFLPDGWVYLKIYCSSEATDMFLIRRLPRIVYILKKQEQITNWFFIRYTDEGGQHLRVRFKYDVKKQYLEIINLFFNQIKLTTDKIDRVTIDTYDREIGRYGVNTILTVEQIFNIDSNIIVRILKARGHATQNRWLDAFALILFYIRAISDDQSWLINLIVSLSQSYKDRFNPNRQTFTQINALYNQNKVEIYKVCESPMIRLRIKSNEKELLLGYFATIRTKLEKSKTLPFENVVGSIIHMSLNRIFRDNQNRNEFIIYELLIKALKYKLLISS